MDAGIAQQVEQRTCNAKVPSSILGAGTNPALLGDGVMSERSKEADCKSAGYAYAGSNPAPSTILNTDAADGQGYARPCCYHTTKMTRTGVTFAWQKRSLSARSHT